MKVIDKSVYSFSKDNAPFTYADPGEVLLFQTMDCFSDTITREDQLADDLDVDLNPAAGPVYINGAEPGDVLVVDILDIQVAEQGVMCTFDGCGPLSGDMENRTRVVKIKDGIASFNDVKFYIDPMIGVIGTAPDGEPVRCGSPGNHGGNMDSKLIKKGARVYFPVRVSGALLQMGDIHASMGDGELCGAGLEIKGEIMVKTSLIKGFGLNWPVTETASHWYVNSCAHELPEASKLACGELQRLICNAYGWDKTDAYLYMSVQSDLEINQACKPCSIEVTLRLKTPKLSQFKPLIG